MISTEEVLRAYEETGIEPCSVTIGLVEDGRVVRACGLGAYGIWAGLWSAEDATQDEVMEFCTFNDEVSYDRAAKLHGQEYIDGWYRGFDYAMTNGEWGAIHGDPLEMPVDVRGFKHGYESGKAVLGRYPHAERGKLHSLDSLVKYIRRDEVTV